MTSASQIDWGKVAAEFSFAAGLTYLNSGTEGSLPRRMQAVLSEAVAQWASDPSGAFFDLPRLNSAEIPNRARLAAFVGAPEADVLITDNTTMGLAMVLLGLAFRAGDEVITTQHDHFSLYSPLDLLAATRGVKVIKVPLPTPASDAEQIVERFRAAVTPNTRAFCFSHVNYTTGLRMPVADLTALARSIGGVLTLVDGAHGLGMLDLDLPALGCDFYASSGHKWFNGPPATGILYIKDANANPWNLQAILSEDSNEVGVSMTIAQALQKRGELNGPAFRTLACGCDFLDTIGKPAVEQRILTLSRQVAERAIDLWGPGCLFSPIPGPGAEALRTGFTAFLPSRDAALAYDADFVGGVAKALKARRIWVLSTQFPGPPEAQGRCLNTIRVSTNLYNSEQDIDRLFAELQTLLPS